MATTASNASNARPRHTRANKHCTDCGRVFKTPPGESPKLKCPQCREATVEDRHEYSRAYHKARSRAYEALRRRYPQLYLQLLAQARVEVEMEERGDAVAS